MTASQSAGPANEVTFTPTLADTQAAYRLHALRPKRVAFPALTYGAIFAAIALYFGDTPGHAAIAFAIGCGAILLVWALWFAVALPFRVRRVYRQQANLRGEHIVAWTETGLAVQSLRANAAMPWTDYIGRKENAASVLLYHSDLMFQFIPKRVLDPAKSATLRPYLDQVPIKP